MDKLLNRIFCGDSAKLLKEFPSDFVDIVISSPPYFWLRDYGVKGQIGLERSPEDYVESLMKVFRELKRILKPTGTFFLNIGDTYSGSHCGYGQTKQSSGFQNVVKQTYYPSSKQKPAMANPSAIPAKSMLCIPERLLFALLEDGWILRNKIIWAKVPPMPSSVKDRFSSTYEVIYFLVKNKKYFFDLEAVKIPYSQYTLERIKKFIQNSEHFNPKKHKHNHSGQSPFEVLENTVKSALSFNYRVRLAKQKRHKDYLIKATDDEIKNYHEGLKENKKSLDSTKKVDGWIGYEKLISGYFPKNSNGAKSRVRLDSLSLFEKIDLSGLKKNPGDIWFLPSANFKGAHFAVFPISLVEMGIKAGCPEFICNNCGKEREKKAEVLYIPEGESAKSQVKTSERNKTDALNMGCMRPQEMKYGRAMKITKSVNYTDCGCNAGFHPGVVLDPFSGSGTTLAVAKSLGRNYIGIDLNPDYIKMAERRIAKLNENKKS